MASTLRNIRDLAFVAFVLYVAFVGIPYGFYNDCNMSWNRCDDHGVIEYLSK